jgi:hypothetical protein
VARGGEISKEEIARRVLDKEVIRMILKERRLTAPLLVTVGSESVKIDSDEDTIVLRLGVETILGEGVQMAVFLMAYPESAFRLAVADIGPGIGPEAITQVMELGDGKDSAVAIEPGVDPERTGGILDDELGAERQAAVAGRGGAQFGGQGNITGALDQAGLREPGAVAVQIDEPVKGDVLVHLEGGAKGSGLLAVAVHLERGPCKSGRQDNSRQNHDSDQRLHRFPSWGSDWFLILSRCLWRPLPVNSYL